MKFDIDAAKQTYKKGHRFVSLSNFFHYFTIYDDRLIAPCGIKELFCSFVTFASLIAIIVFATKIFGVDGFIGAILCIVIFSIFAFVMSQILFFIARLVVRSTEKDLKAYYFERMKEYFDPCTIENDPKVIANFSIFLEAESVSVQNHYITYSKKIEDDYGDIIVYEKIKDKIYDTPPKYEEIDFGFQSFNEKYLVHTQNKMKARAYFSATLLDFFAHKSPSFDYFVGKKFEVHGKNVTFTFFSQSSLQEIDLIAEDVDSHLFHLENELEEIGKHILWGRNNDLLFKED